MIQFERFSSNFDDFNFLDEEGKIITNKKEYFEKKRKDMLTYTEILNVGDIVVLKTTHDILQVKHVNYEIMNVVFDYAGLRIDGLDDNLVLFCQEDIDRVIEKKNKFHK